jgi:3-oxoacyl-[acyl-carrier protein] reductase
MGLRDMRNVLVTGGSRGLGLAIASRLVSRGYHVIALARSRSDELLTAMAASGGALTFRALDLAQTDAIGRFVGELRREVGPLYGLINNAGSGSGGLLSMMRDADIEALVRLNTLSPIVLTKYVLRSMMAARAGRIVNISSIVATSGYKALSAYSATKAALEGFTRSLAREVGPLGITVNAVAPGFVDTAMTQELTQGEREQIIRRSALHRMVTPADVVGAVEYLLGEEAQNITGTVLTVDAGNTA